MARNLAGPLAGLLLAASPAAAEPPAGHIGLTWSGFSGNEGDDMTRLALDGSAGFAMTPGFGLQLDGAYASYGESDREGRTLGLHGVFNLVDGAAFGLYGGFDWLGSREGRFYGVEYGQSFGQFDGEAYLGGVDGWGDHGTTIGARGRMAVGSGAGVGLRLDRLDVGEFDSTRYALTGDLAVGNGFVLGGEIGAADTGKYGSEPYFSLGGKLTFGGEQGARFGQRGVLTLLPGF